MAFNPPGGSGGIAGATDVTLDSPQDDQVLAYDSDSAKWQNQNSTGGSPSITNLPAGSTISRVYSGSAWPSRGTSRTDIVVQWIDFAGDAPVPSEAIEDLDVVIKDAGV